MKHAMFSLGCIAVLFSGCTGAHQEKKDTRSASGVEEVEVLEILPERERANNFDRQGAEKATSMRNGGSATSANSANMQERDAEIIQAIRRALADDSFLARYVAIRITSNNGDVVLRGVVETTQDRDALEKKVRALRAVKKVDNRLEVAPTPARSNAMR